MTTSSSAYRVLIVDDSDVFRFLLTKYLQIHGFTSIAQAEDGLQALSMIRDTKPDLVFVDGIMPGMDGAATIREIRAIDPAAVIGVITGLSEHNQIAEFKEAGADMYLQKPIELGSFQQTIQEALALLTQRTGR